MRILAGIAVLAASVTALPASADGVDCRVTPHHPLCKPLERTAVVPPAVLYGGPQEHKVVYASAPAAFVPAEQTVSLTPATLGVLNGGVGVPAEFIAFGGGGTVVVTGGGFGGGSAVASGGGTAVAFARASSNVTVNVRNFRGSRRMGGGKKH